MAEQKPNNWNQLNLQAGDIGHNLDLDFLKYNIELNTDIALDQLRAGLALEECFNSVDDIEPSLLRFNSIGHDLLECNLNLILAIKKFL